MNKNWLIASVVFVVILFGIGYLERYEYFKLAMGDGIELELRTNRYTNETDRLNGHGWNVVQTSDFWNDLHWNETHPPHTASLEDIK